MKKILIVVTMLLLYLISQAQNVSPVKVGKIKKKITDSTPTVLVKMEMNEILTSAINNFRNLKGSPETDDEFNFGDNGYKSRYCLQGSSKCELYISEYMPQFAARFGAKIMNEEQAFALYDSLFKYISTTPLVWGLSQVNYSIENGSGKAANFIRDLEVDTENKFSNTTISIKTNYIDDDKYQVLMYITN